MKITLPTDWSYSEFYVFAMLYAANADAHITDEEIALIRPTVNAEQFTAIKTAFNSCSDAEALDHILSYREQYFPTPAAKEQLIADMQLIFDADEKFTIVERSFRQLFLRLI
jgi:hypothetical protein